jgi:hypothetical protein
MQFEGLAFSTMPLMVWRPWASSKYKIFLLVLQNRVWTTDRLQRCGYKNYGITNFVLNLKKPLHTFF